MKPIHTQRDAPTTPYDPILIASRTDLLTGLDPAPVDSMWLEMMHRQDPGWFLCCWAGLLYFCASHLPPFNLSQNVPPSFSFGVSLPIQYDCTFYQSVYTRWHRTSPVAQQLHSEFTQQIGDEIRPKTHVARAFFEGSRAIGRNLPLAQIKQMIIRLLRTPLPQDLDEATIRNWHSVYLDVPIDVRTTWAPSLPDATTPAGCGQRSSGTLQTTQTSEQKNSTVQQCEMPPIVSNPTTDEWAQYHRHAITTFRENIHSYGTYVRERHRTSRNLTMSMIDPPLARFSIELGESEAHIKSTPRGRGRPSTKSRLDREMPSNGGIGEFGDASAPGAFIRLQARAQAEMQPWINDDDGAVSVVEQMRDYPLKQ